MTRSAVLCMFVFTTLMTGCIFHTRARYDRDHDAVHEEVRHDDRPVTHDEHQGDRKDNERDHHDQRDHDDADHRDR